jgi:class 3 adenylate cyclase/CheY-like chemotaxis protein
MSEDPDPSDLFDFNSSMHETSEEAARAEQAAAQSLQSARILVVDDSKMMRMGITRDLKKLGFTNVAEASNGREALEKLRAESFDLMLLDVEMPEMTGLEVLAEMRKDESLSLPTIVISGGEDVSSAVSCIEMGAEDYLPKPFNPVLLRARVTTSIEKKKLRNLEKLRLAQIESEHARVVAEQEKTEKLLLNILPRSIAGRLKGGEKLIADAHQSVTVLFMDLVGFTKLSRTTTPDRLVKMLNAIFSTFDLLVERSGLEKIKTIGDSYMLVGGAPELKEGHAQAAADLALAMIENLAKINAVNQTELAARIGLNSGPVVAGVIGIRKFTYDLWGDTVNIASRMESSGMPGRVHCSQATADLLREEFELEDRGPVEVKSIGHTHTYFINARKIAEWSL